MLPNQSKYQFKSCYTVKETAVHFTKQLDVGWNKQSFRRVSKHFL